ncbi:MAG: TIGR02266 family protein [Myxococcaceae bacterium]
MSLSSQQERVVAFRPTVVQNVPTPSPDADAELRRAEQEVTAAELHWASEAIRLETAATELTRRLQSLRAAAVELALATPDAAAIAHRAEGNAVPALNLMEPVEQARAAREHAVKVRLAASESSRHLLAAFATEVTRIHAQLSADEASLAVAEKKVREGAARKAAHPPPPVAAPLAESARPPTAPARATAHADLGRSPLASRVDAEQKVAAERAQVAEPAPATSLQRRENARVRMQAAIDMTSDSNFFTGFSTNLSEGGIFVATVATLKQGTEVDLRFSLPGGAKLDVKGVVRWIREVNDATPEIFPGVGIQFVNLAPEVSQAIHRFVGQREPLFYPD